MEKLIELEMEKREEIVNNFNKNYLLEAGAGAGKTTIIVERVINHIIDGDIDPGNIVAITFTKAASLELAERIQRKALDYLSQEKYAYARDKLERVEEIFTGTIHSFCELLLREMPFEAGLTPGYEIIEDSQEFYNNIWYEYLREFEDEYKDDLEILNLFGVDYRDFKSATFVAMDNPDVKFTGFSKGRKFKDIKDSFESLDAKELDPSYIKTGSNLGKLFISMIEEKKDFEHYIEEILTEFVKLDEDEDLASKFLYKKHLKSPGAEEIVNFIEDLFSIYKDLNASIYNMAIDFSNRIVQYKDKAYTNRLTFNDLLFRASKLIRNSKKAREHFKGKFKYFYIDEAQDTDPMQAELLLLLSHEGDLEGLESLEDVSPREGSLFIVGDPKQSIYRFRRADITIYESVKKIIEARGEVVYLDINFRSTDFICRWVEENFKNREDGFAFREKSTNFQAGFEKILSLWKANREMEEGEKFSGVYGYDFSQELEVKEEDYVAGLIEDIIKNGYIDEKLGRGHINTRRVENKDIMILTKSNEETGRYLNALKGRNIPALLAGEKRLGDTREVLNLFLLVDLLIDYRDKIKLVAVLRNSFYLELESINLSLGEEGLKDIIMNEEKIKDLKHPHVKEAFFHLREIFLASERERPIAFIELLIKNKLGIYDLHKEYSQIEKRDADSSLVQALEILKSKRPISLYSIREELRRIIDEKVNYELPIDLSFAENAVRVMNIHKAKGLEAEIVVLAGSDKNRTLGGDSHYVEKVGDENLGYLVFKRSTLVRCPEESIRSDREKMFKDAELDRLIYVAATRSKSVLVTPRIAEERAFLAPLSQGELEILDEPSIESPEMKDSFTPRKLEEIRITNLLKNKLGVSKPSYLKMSPSSLDSFKERRDNLELINNRTSPRGKIYGDMVHRALQILLKNKRDLQEILEEKNYAIGLSIKESLEDLEIDSFILKGLYPALDFNEEDRTNIKLQVESFLKLNLEETLNSFLKNKEVVDLISNSKRIFTEFPFSSPIDPLFIDKRQGAEKALVNGYIDLLIELKDGNLVIIDYKTDIVGEGQSRELFKERYSKQLEIYKRVIEDRLGEEGKKVTKLLIYSTYLEKIISL